MKHYKLQVTLTISVLLIVFLSFNPFIKETGGEGLERTALINFGEGPPFSLFQPMFMFLLLGLLGVTFLVAKSESLKRLSYAFITLAFLGMSLNLYAIHLNYEESLSRDTNTLTNSALMIIFLVVLGIIIGVLLIFNESISLYRERNQRHTPQQLFRNMDNPFELLKEWQDVHEHGSLSKQEFDDLKKKALNALIENYQRPIIKIELLKRANMDGIISDKDLEESKVRVLRTLNISH